MHDGKDQAGNKPYRQYMHKAYFTKIQCFVL